MPRRPPLALVVLLALLSSALACPIYRDRDPSEGEGEGEQNDAGPDYPAPLTDVTDCIGTPEKLDIATWNVKNFPCGNSSNSSVCRGNAADTPSLAADIIASMDLDLVAVQEIADEAAFQELVDRLPEHEGVLSDHTYGDGSYQKIGFIYRASVLTAGAPNLLFITDDNFPRPALQVGFTWTGDGGPVELFAVSVHLKAGEEDLDFIRRGASIDAMEQYARTLVDGAGQDNIIFLGDFNENLRQADGLANFAPFQDAARYTIRTKANSDAREVSFIPGNVILDHIVTTRAFDTAFGTARPVIPGVDDDVTAYRDRISDHLPVTVSLDP